MLKTVILSDGLECKVRQLGLFELDGKGREVLGIFRYTLLLASGQFAEDEYDVRALTYTPTRPDIPIEDIKSNSPEWYQLQDFDTYTAALAHEKLRLESYEGFVNDITAYILTHCLSDEDRNRIISSEDWNAVYLAALVPELTIEGVADTLESTFQGYIWQPAYT
jgi:hypothetical protein